MTINTLDRLHAQSIEHDRLKFDINAPDGRFNINNFGYVDVAPDLWADDQRYATMPMTSWALGQLCAKLRVPRSYVERCPSWLMAENLNHWIGKDDRGWLIRGMAHGDNNMVRAFLSDSYVPLSNSFVLQTIIELVEEDGGFDFRVDPSLDPDGLWIKFETQDVQLVGEKWSVGFVVRNGEIGNRMVEVAAITKRGPCDNTIEFPWRWQQKHIHIGPNELRYMLHLKIAHALQMGEEMTERISAAAEEEMPSLSSLVHNLAADRGYSDDIVDAIFIGVTDQTRLGLANGVSYAAHNVAMTEDDQIRMEQLAGDILARNLFASASVAR